MEQCPPNLGRGDVSRFRVDEGVERGKDGDHIGVSVTACRFTRSLERCLEVLSPHAVPWKEYEQDGDDAAMRRHG
jgi:hypothetical protein